MSAFVGGRKFLGVRLKVDLFPQVQWEKKKEPTRDRTDNISNQPFQYLQSTHTVLVIVGKVMKTDSLHKGDGEASCLELLTSVLQ